MSRFRHEDKYIIDLPQKEILNIKVKTLLKPDEHAGKDNKYTIRSLYLDNIAEECLKDNLYGKDPRSKYRIRYYNNDTSHIVLEKKTKKRSMCLKESIIISKKECEEIILGKIPIIKTNDSLLRKQILSDLLTKSLLPKTIVTYDRTPYVYGPGNVRITFDDNISSSNDIKHFLECDYIQRPILPIGQSILEVKWDELLPKHIQNVMMLNNLEWTAFSKYFMCRVMHI